MPKDFDRPATDSRRCEPPARSLAGEDAIARLFHHPAKAGEASHHHRLGEHQPQPQDPWQDRTGHSQEGSGLAVSVGADGGRKNRRSIYF